MEQYNRKSIAEILIEAAIKNGYTIELEEEAVGEASAVRLVATPSPAREHSSGILKAPHKKEVKGDYEVCLYGTP